MMAVIANVLSQHADGASLLWLVRREATGAPHHLLRDLATLDRRVEAHLDGLRIAGQDGWNVCEEQLAIGEDGEAFVAGVLAFESGSAALVRKVLHVAEHTPDVAGSVASALGWLEFEDASQQIQRLSQGGAAIHQRIAIAASAIHRRHSGDTLARAVRSEFQSVRARALKAAGELQDATLIGELTKALDDSEPECRFAAAWSGALLGVPVAVTVSQEIAESGSRRAARAADVAVRRMDVPAAVSWQQRLAGDLRHARLAIEAAGAIGDPALVPWVIPCMEQLPLARLAGQSFTLITGVDLADQDFEGPWPEGFTAGPTEDPEDENVEMDPDENLPWPDRQKVAAWWHRNRDRFEPGTRYLCGQPISEEWCEHMLRYGYQRQRAAAALELAIRRPGTPLFNVKAPGHRQQQLLGL